MQDSPLTLGVYGPERLRFSDRLRLSARLREALRGLHVSGARVTGAPAWLVRQVARRCGASVAAPAQDCDVMLFLWDGTERPDDPSYRRARDFVAQHGAEAIRVVPLRGAQRAGAPQFGGIQEHFSRDVFFCACPEDAAIARRVLRKARRFRAPAQNARRTGRRQLKAPYLSDAATLSDRELEMLPSTRNLVLFLSDDSACSGKMDQATERFSDTRGRQYMQLALAGKEKRPGSPAGLFPARFRRTDETYTDAATGQTLTFGQEPLACDFRGGELSRQQFLRLMAPLFGSTYDDLYRRSRQRLVRRVTAVAAVVVAVAAVSTGVLWSLARDAQRNESLANANREVAEAEALEAENQATLAGREAANAQAQATLAREKADEAAEAAKTAEAEDQNAQAQATLAQENAALEQAAAAEAVLRAEEAEEQAALAAAQAEEAATQAKLAEESLQRAEEQATLAQTHMESAQQEAELAVSSSAEALRMQTTRLVRDARLEAQDGNVLSAVQLLLDATPFEGSSRELNPEAEMLLRTLLGGGEVFPVLKLPGRSLLGMDGETLTVRDDETGAVTRYNLRTGESGVPGGDSPAGGAPAPGSLSFALENGHVFALDARGNAQLLDAGGFVLEEVKKAHGRRPLGLTAALDGRRLVSWSADEILVWGVVPGNARTVLAAHDGPIAQLWVGEAGFATAGRDGLVRRFDAAGHLLQTLDAGRPLSSLEIQEALQQAVTCARDGTVQLWDLATGEALWRHRVPGMGVARLDPEGRSVVVGLRVDAPTMENSEDALDYSGTGMLLRAADGSEITAFPCSGIPWYGEIFGKKHGDDTFVAINIRDVYGFSTADGTPVWEQTLQLGLGSNAILSKLDYIYMFGDATAIGTFGTPDKYPYYAPHGGPITFAIPNPARTPGEVLSVGFDFTVMINHTKAVPGTGDLAYVRQHRYRHGGTVRSAAFSRDGAYAVTASADGTAAILTSGGPFQVLENGRPLTGADFLADGSSAITVDEEGRVVLWPLGDFPSARARAEELMLP